MSFKEDKLKSAFLEEINLVLSKKQDLKELGFVTITDVEVLDEGRNINVYFSCFEGEEKPEKLEEISQYLLSLVPEIKNIIRKRVKTRYIPNISFKYDKTPLKASRIEEILKKIELERSDASKDKGNPQN